MLNELKQTASVAYRIAVIVVCSLFAVLTARYAWQQRAAGLSNVVVFIVFALFLAYAAVVLIFQAVQMRRYAGTVDALRLVPVEWKDVPFQDVIPSILQNRKKEFLSRVVHGETCGVHIYLFSSARDVAWWSKKKTSVIFERLQAQNSNEGMAERLSKRAEADLTFHRGWCLIQARHEIKPDALAQWLETIAAIARCS